MTQAAPKLVSLKRWHRRTFAFHDQEIALEVKALLRSEAPAFLTEMGKLGKEWARLSAADDASFLTLVDAEMLAEAFRSYVRVPKGETIEFDGETVDAARLHQEGNAAFVFGVLLAINGLAVMNNSEGKASGSRSGSTSEQTRNGDSAVPPTETAAGTTHSTVTPVPAIEPSAPSVTA